MWPGMSLYHCAPNVMQQQFSIYDLSSSHETNTRKALCILSCCEALMAGGYFQGQQQGQYLRCAQFGKCVVCIKYEVTSTQLLVRVT